jgi:hypothetical protein
VCMNVCVCMYVCVCVCVCVCVFVCVCVYTGTQCQSLRRREVGALKCNGCDPGRKAVVRAGVGDVRLCVGEPYTQKCQKRPRNRPNNKPQSPMHTGTPARRKGSPRCFMKKEILQKVSGLLQLVYEVKWRGHLRLLRMCACRRPPCSPAARC